MSGAPKLRSLNVTDKEDRPIRSAGNKTRSSLVPCKPASKLLRETERVESGLKEKKKASSMVTDSLHLSPPMSALEVLRRQELQLQSNFSLNASCSSDASTDSFCSHASTGRIGRPSFTTKRRQGIPKPNKIVSNLEKIVPDGAVAAAVGTLQLRKRCAWVTPNTDPVYVTFHDEEWGVPVHDDRKLFELLVLSGALAELSWPTILRKRQLFREVFMDFDPVMVSKLNEKKLIVPGSIASSLLPETKLRAIVENGRLILKIIEEFGSFDNYCWSFVNHKTIVSRFRYPRQVPVKTPKADLMSKDLLRRDFRGVGPTVMYSFMQAAGITNDHLIGCYKFEECCAAVNFTAQAGAGCTNGGEELKFNSNKIEERRLDDVLGMEDIDLELVRDEECESVA